MTVSSQELTEQVDNFKIEGANIAITKNRDNERGNSFYRVSAFQYLPSGYSTFNVDYFGNDSEFKELMSGDIEETPATELEQALANY